jgi:hypothetical protein
MKGRREPPRPHCKSGPLTDDELYNEVPCRDVPLTREDEAWQKKFIEDRKPPPVKKPA